MKILKLIAVAFLGVMALSCSDEDREKAANNITNELEVSFLKSDEIFNTLKIENIGLQKGNPPTPSGNISFKSTVPEANAEGELPEGTTEMNIEIVAPDNTTGVYAQLATRQGETVDRFFDISIANIKSKAKSLESTVDRTFNLNIAVTKDFPVGTFCLSLCVYDAAGNIASPVLVHATIVNVDGVKFLTTIKIVG